MFFTTIEYQNYSKPNIKQLYIDTFILNLQKTIFCTTMDCQLKMDIGISIDQNFQPLLKTYVNYW